MNLLEPDGMCVVSFKGHMIDISPDTVFCHNCGIEEDIPPIVQQSTAENQRLYLLYSIGFIGSITCDRTSKLYDKNGNRIDRTDGTVDVPGITTTTTTNDTVVGTDVRTRLETLYRRPKNNSKSVNKCSKTWYNNEDRV